MECSPSTDTVCGAIYTLYNDPNPSEKEKASSFLNQLQQSVYAWKIADEILIHKTDVEMCYFAAQTLKVKIQNSFHELPMESHQSLRDSLINHLIRITSNNAPVIVTQLSLALTHLALQMATWKNPIDDLASRFGNDLQLVIVLLEILIVLPEEVMGRNLRLGANRRAEVVDILRESSPKVLHLLSSCVQSFSQNETILRKVYSCLGSWFSVKALPSSDSTLLSLVNFGFQILSNPETKSMVHEAVSDAVCAALLLVEDTSNHQLLAEVLFRGTYSLVDAYHVAVAQEDTDKAVNYCGIFTELANSFLDQILEFPNVGFGNLQNLDLLLICVGHHDFEVAEVTFSFWYRLSEALYKRDNESLNQVFEPYIQRLIIALCKHCQLDQDYEGVPEEGDDFAEFRNRVSENIKDSVFVIGSAKCFEQMYENLKNQGSSASWDITEAALFVMCAVAKNILPEESKIVPQVVESILNLPDSTHIAVRYTSTQLLGELSYWIEKHPQYLDPVLNFLLKCLQHASLANVSATSLKYICSVCCKQMSSHFSGLLQVLQAVDRLHVPNEAVEGLLKGIAMILGQMPFDKITAGLRELCQTQMKPLEEPCSYSSVDHQQETVKRLATEQLVSVSGAEKEQDEVLKADKSYIKEGTKSDPALWLDRLAAIFRHTMPQVVNGQVHPCQPVVQDVWPLLSACCNKYQGDTRVIERCCRCIRFVVRCVGKQSAMLLEPLVKQMVELYQHHQHSCFLYLGSILVDEYGSEPGCVQGLLDMLQAFCGPTFRILEQPNGLRDHPDTVDDLFRLCARFLQWAPVPFLQCPALKPILHCAILACSLDHRDANASVMKFFHDLINGSHVREDRESRQDVHQRQALVKQIIMEYGQNLMNALISASVYSLPTYMLVNVANVIYELVVFDKACLSNWLENSLKWLPTKSSGGSITATPKQLSEFHKNVVSAQHVKTVSVSLREFSRLFR